MSVVKWFWENLYANCFTLVTVILSGIISWGISAVYYYKGNRTNLKVSVILPIRELLLEPYSATNYKSLCKISNEFSVKYMRKEERDVLNSLKVAYKEIYMYKESAINAGILFDHFEKELKKNNINWKPVPVTFNNEVVDYEPPQGWFELSDDIERILNKYDIDFEFKECENAVVNLFNAYCKQYFSTEKIPFFVDKKFTKVLMESSIAEDWNRKFENMKKQKEKFLNLKIVKETIA